MPGRQEHQGNVSVSVNANVCTTAARFARVTVGTTAVELKVGASPLSGRTSVLVTTSPDNTANIFIGIGTNDTLTTANAGDCLTPGAGRVYEVSSAEVVVIKAISTAVAQYVYITEVK